MVMATPSPQQVGREFVRQYYTVLHEAPEVLHRFYSSVSTFVHGGVDRPGIAVEEPVVGQLEIDKKIKQLNFKDCHTKIRQVDSQATIGNGVVVQVTGELSNNGEPMRRFMQTFLLAPQTPKKFYVHNDIFRYQDEVYHDISSDSEDLEEEVVQQQQQQYENGPQKTNELIQNHIQHQQQQQQPPSQQNNNLIDEMSSASTAAVAAAAAVVNGHLPSSASSENTEAQVKPVVINNDAADTAVLEAAAAAATAKVEMASNANNRQLESDATINSITEAAKQINLSSSSSISSASNPSNIAVAKEQQIQQHQQQQQQQQEVLNTDAKNSWAQIINRGDSIFTQQQQQQQPQHNQQNTTNNNNKYNNKENGPQQQQQQQKSQVQQNSNQFLNNNNNNNSGGNNAFGNFNNLKSGQQQQQQNFKNIGKGSVPNLQQQQQQSQSSLSRNNNNNNNVNNPNSMRNGLPNNNNMEIEEDKRQYFDGQQIFVGNLSPDLTEAELAQYFSTFGKVAEIRINTNTKQQSGRRLPNYGFVVFEERQSVELLLGSNKSSNITYKNDKGIEYRLNIEEKRTRQGRAPGFTGNNNNNSAGKNRANRSTSNGSGGSKPQHQSQNGPGYKKNHGYDSFGDNKQHQQANINSVPSIDATSGGHRGGAKKL